MTTNTAETPAQAHCPYCHSNGSTRWDNRSQWGQWGSKDIADELRTFPNELSVNISFPALFNAGGNLYRIHYCPMCGRKLNGEW